MGSSASWVQCNDCTMGLDRGDNRVQMPSATRQRTVQKTTHQLSS
jgi:hypothetical protein